MKKLLVYFLIFCAAFAAAFAWFAGDSQKNPPAEPARPTAPVLTGLPEYREGPPDEAVTGKIEKRTGTVLLFPRTGEIPYEASVGASVVQGDTLLASPSSSVTVSFGEYMKVHIGEASKVSFSGLLPDSLLLWLRQGTAVFANPESARPLAVRILDGLLTLSNASVTVRMKDDSSGSDVTVSSGSATLLQVDSENETRSVALPPGSRAYLDDVGDKITVR